MKNLRVSSRLDLPFWIFIFVISLLFFIVVFFISSGTPVEFKYLTAFIIPPFALLSAIMIYRTTEVYFNKEENKVICRSILNKEFVINDFTIDEFKKIKTMYFLGYHYYYFKRDGAFVVFLSNSNLDMLFKEYSNKLM